MSQGWGTEELWWNGRWAGWGLWFPTLREMGTEFRPAQAELGRGTPISGKERPAGLWPAGLVFLVDSSMANSEGNRAIIFDLYVIDISSSYKLFFEKGLDKISTGAWVGLTAVTDVALRQPRP